MKKIPPPESRPEGKLTRAEISRRYRERHPEKVREEGRKRKQRQRDGASDAERSTAAERARQRYWEDPERHRETQRQRDLALRVEFIAAYGGVCVCCGEDEPAFLCLGHVNGDGCRDRAATGGRNTGVIRRLKREGWPQDGYRLLCANCNTATMRGRTCPHQIKSEVSS